MSKFESISNEALETVFGGKTSPPTHDMSTMGDSASGNDAAVVAALQGIQSSLNDLGKNNSNGLFGGNNGLLFMTMALAMSRRGEVVVSGGRGGGNYYWRSSW
jgi:hypothetical protein